MTELLYYILACQIYYITSLRMTSKLDALQPSSFQELLFKEEEEDSHLVAGILTPVSSCNALQRNFVNLERYE